MKKLVALAATLAATTLAATTFAVGGLSTSASAFEASDPASGTGALLTVDPGAAGPYAVVGSDYQLPRVRIAGLPRPVEMIGHVVEPAAEAATGPRPLVLFLHGRHPWCYDPAGGEPTPTDKWPCAAPQVELPNHLGYDYLQRRLASQGFTTVSILANGISAQDATLLDAGSGARAALVQQHLRYWAGIASAHQVDLSRVVLVGQSRGGEGVDRAATEIAPDAPFRVVGQVLLSPTDAAAHAAPYIPTVVVLPSCDGDVADLQGQRYVDSSRDVFNEGPTADTALRSAVIVEGANHRYFNTEWTPGGKAPASDDWQGPATEPCGRRHPDRLKAPQQRAVGTSLVSAAVRLFTGVDDSGLPLLDGSGARAASYGDADVRSHAIGGGRDLRAPGVTATPTTSSPAMLTRSCAGALASHASGQRACGRGITDAVAPSWRGPDDTIPTREFVELSWDHPGGAGGLQLASPLDLTTGRLELRTIIDPARGPIDVNIRVTDSKGASIDLQPLGGSRVTPLPAPTMLWAQALVTDPAAAANPTGVDLSDVRSVQLVPTRATAGSGSPISQPRPTPSPRCPTCKHPGSTSARYVASPRATRLPA